MNTLALNQRQLSRFTHHWFWGLRVDHDDNNETLYDAARRLNENPREQDEMALQLQRIRQLPWLILAVYWFFNISQYRKNYYTLHAYACLQHYQQGIRMLSPEDRAQAEDIGGFLLLVLAFNFVQPLRQAVQDAIAPSMDWFTDSLAPYLSEHLPRITRMAQEREERLPLLVNGPIVPVVNQLDIEKGLPQGNDNELELIPSFIVQRVMIRALATLGLTTNDGQRILFSTLKTAYRNSLHRTHPDKTGANDSEPFIQVRAAFRLILDEIKQHEATETSHNFFSTFHNSITVLEQMVEQEVMAWRALRVEVGQYNERVDKHVKYVDEHVKYVDEHVKYVEQFVTAVKSYCERVDRNNEAIKELSRLRQAEQAEEDAIDAIIAFADMYDAVDPSYDARMKAEQAEEDAIDAIIALADMYDAVEAYPPYTHQGKNRHRFIGGDRTTAVVAHEEEEANPSPTLRSNRT